MDSCGKQHVEELTNRPEMAELILKQMGLYMSEAEPKSK